ncbi:hypothetical protein J2046_002726 [Rhizobium petrolearium]|uniref:hypothetical protein n=1 Tax=Neorhizobium petrolearium TaxID=515361 RepID=UPI001AE17BC8|nr:hypothetical protein [Neorhizobium petrolearium]MBP1844467.1 hypothetical protein [Neorhizobium petrolearium]
MDVMSETYRYHGEQWRRIPAQASDRFVMGVDLGQSNDPTAISVIHHSVTPLDDWELNRSIRETRQKVKEHFDVRHLERVPLGTPYPQIVQRVADLLGRPPLRDGCDLVVDETGVGRAVSDIFETAGMRPQRVAITAGSEITNPDNRRWHVPKGLLISTVDAMLHVGELRFAANLTDAGALAEELKDFRRKVSEAGRATYNARTGKHDDLILSIAIALWWARRPPVRFAASAMVGLYD